MVRLTLSVQEGIPERLAELAGGQRKIGMWLSSHIQELSLDAELADPERAAADSQAQWAAIDGLTASGQLLEGRVGALERQVLTLVAAGRGQR